MSFRFHLVSENFERKSPEDYVIGCERSMFCDTCEFMPDCKHGGKRRHEVA